MSFIVLFKRQNAYIKISKVVTQSTKTKTQNIKHIKLKSKNTEVTNYNHRTQNILTKTQCHILASIFANYLPIVSKNALKGKEFIAFLEKMTSGKIVHVIARARSQRHDMHRKCTEITAHRRIKRTCKAQYLCWKKIQRLNNPWLEECNILKNQSCILLIGYSSLNCYGQFLHKANFLIYSLF